MKLRPSLLPFVVSVVMIVLPFILLMFGWKIDWNGQHAGPFHFPTLNKIGYFAVTILLAIFSGYDLFVRLSA